MIHIVLSLLWYFVRPAGASSLPDAWGIQPLMPCPPSMGRGAWSPPPDRTVDLNGDWRVTSAPRGFPDEVSLPALWDPRPSEVVLSRNFVLPSDTSINQWQLVLTGVCGGVTVTLNGHHLDARRGEDFSLRLDLNPHHIRPHPQPNRLDLAIDGRFYRRRNLPLEGGVGARRRWSGVSGGVFLSGSPSPAIYDLVPGRLRRNADGSQSGTVVADLRSVRVGVQPDSGWFSLNVSDENGRTWFSYPSRQVTLTAEGRLKLEVPFTIPAQAGSVLTAEAVLAGKTDSSRMWACIRPRPLEMINGTFVWGGDPRPIRFISFIPTLEYEVGMRDQSEAAALIDLIQDMGATGLRFSQGTPTPILLEECERRGLPVLLEMPLYQVPDGVLAESDFLRSASVQMEAMVMMNRRYACVAGWGLGAMLNPPNPRNLAYFQTLRDVVRRLDDRPVFASVPLATSLTLNPLDFAIVEISAFGEEVSIEELVVSADCPVLIGGIRRLIVPGELGGYDRPFTESGQAEFLLNSVSAVERGGKAAGVVVGDLYDWRGAVPTLSGPFRGWTDLFTTGLVDYRLRPRLAYLRLKEYWASGRTEPLRRVGAEKSSGGWFAAAGLGLLGVLFAASRQNKLFRLNLSRALVSPRNFFGDISARRYYQHGHTVLLAVLVTGVLAGLAAAMLHSFRNRYSLDWAVGAVLGGGKGHRIAAGLIWQPLRGWLFFWVASLGVLIAEAVRASLTSRVFGRRCTFVQGLDFVVWSAVVLLGALPVLLFAEHLFRTGKGFLAIGWVLLLGAIATVRLVQVLHRHIQRPVGLVAAVWFAVPAMVTLLGALGLEYTRAFSLYWRHFWSSII